MMGVASASLTIDHSFGPPGMEDSDGIEGLYLEKVAVSGRDPEGEEPRGGRSGKSAAALLLGGVPYHHYISAQCNKDHRAVQASTCARRRTEVCAVSTAVKQPCGFSRATFAPCCLVSSLSENLAVPLKAIVFPLIVSSSF